jgi:thiosulfate/3-mercaptopyruvate sulfurtransferase
MLITPQALSQHLDDPRWVVFDTRHDLTNPAKGPEAYAAGHIPGAYFVSVDHDMSGTKTGRNGRHPLPDLDAFSKRMSACGVAPGVQVVIYDDAGGTYAVRLWWLLRWLGHDKVALLDGGLPLWQKEGRPLTTEAPAPRKGDFVARPQLGATVDAAFVERFREDTSLKLVDARAPERFSGKTEPLDPVAGHVPGAVNRFWKENLAADGRFKAPTALREEFKQLLGSSHADEAVHMCGSGVTACHNLFAMELAGLAGGRLYPGSWSEWCSDPARPVARS